jgi:FKBP-type peptidyl-prolyl cis-trans isomerase SlyD
MEVMSESERRVVTFHYTLRNDANKLLDTSSGGEPISFLEGSGLIIDGLDHELRSWQPGQKGFVVVPAAQGYGERDPQQVRKVPRHVLPVEGDLKVGDQFQTAPDRGAPVVTVVGIEEDGVVLDANHPLAGVDLNFEVELVAARAATAKELEHGHVHAPNDTCG